ncbi:MAG: phage tail protein [Phycisphaerales bacterium]
MEPFIGQIMLFAGNFAVRGWALCDGQLLPISQHSALFSILGTQYGGNGESTFGLPDLRGRVPIHMGNGPGLTNRPLGSKSGAETHTLNAGEMPSHSHNAILRASDQEGTSASPDELVIAKSGSGDPDYNGEALHAALRSDSIEVSNNGGNQPHNNMQPYLTLNYQIALVGIFPSRD